MATTQVLHKATTGASGSEKFYFFLAPDGLYTGAIGTACGITKASTNEQDEPITPVKNLVGSNVLRRLTATVEKSGKKYRVQLLVVRSKLLTVEDAIIGETVSTVGAKHTAGVVTSSGVPRKATFY